MSGYDKTINRAKPVKTKSEKELEDFRIAWCTQGPPPPQNGAGQDPARDSVANQDLGLQEHLELRGYTTEAAAKLANQIQARDSAANQGSVRDSAANQGLKYDAEKQPLSLLSKVWLLGVASVMGFGAKKYAAHNWRNGLERSRLLSAALRHILAYNEGEDVDPESKLHHLDHASCCLMFARETHETHPQLDDRWKGKKNET